MFANVRLERCKTDMFLQQVISNVPFYEFLKNPDA